MRLRGIPSVDFPKVLELGVKVSNEKLVSVSESGILCDSQYFKQGIEGAYKDCYARETVVNMLLSVQSNLPDGLRLKVYDAYRPICVQQKLWDSYRSKLKSSNPDLDDDELDKKTSFFVSKPSYDISKPSLHNTGGAVDVTLVDSNGAELNMGTKFDDFSNKAWTSHFESSRADREIRYNRRILYWAMLEGGFTNLPSEWWHYDYGTKFWGYFKGKLPLYSGILDIDFTQEEG